MDSKMLSNMEVAFRGEGAEGYATGGIAVAERYCGSICAAGGEAAAAAACL